MSVSRRSNVFVVAEPVPACCCCAVTCLLLLSLHVFSHLVVRSSSCGSQCDASSSDFSISSIAALRTVATEDVRFPAQNNIAAFFKYNCLQVRQFIGQIHENIQKCSEDPSETNLPQIRIVGLGSTID